MITAKIGDTLLKLESIKDAETLFSIVSKATPLTVDYDEHYKDYFHPAPAATAINITITTDDTLASHDEHLQKVAARQEKQRLAAEKAAAEKASTTSTESN